MKRKLLVILFMLFAMFTFSQMTALAANWEGQGTQESPYLISTPEQLFAIPNSTSAYFKLANDIDLTYFSYEKQKPIENFLGNFDGDNFKIINLNLIGDATTNNKLYLALFSNIFNSTSHSVTIKNVILDSASVTNRGYGNSSSALIGSAYNVTVENCHLVNGVISADSSSSGLILNASNSKILKCSTSGTVSSGAGGAGILLNGDTNVNIEDCFSTMTVSVVEGAVVGISSSYASLKNCYFAGLLYVQQNNYNQNLRYPLAYKDTISVTSCYYDGNKNWDIKRPGGAARSTMDMYKQSTYIDWDFNKTWGIDDGNGYPYLRNMYKNETETEIVLSAPKKLCVEEIDNGLIISWQSVENAQKYEVHLNGDIIEVDTPSIEVNPFINEVIVKVRAVNGEIKGLWSLKIVVEPSKRNESQHVNSKDPNVNVLSQVYRLSESSSNIYANSPQYGPDKALDEDTTTRWATDDNNLEPVVLTVLFKDILAFNEIYFLEYGARTKNFKMEYLDPDKDIWNEFYEGQKIRETTLSSFGDIIAKGVRVIFMREENETGGISIYEFQAKYK